MMKRYLIVFFLFLMVQGQAQQAPWSKSPMQKTTLDPYSGEEITIYLYLDTLFKNADKHAAYKTWISNWYKDDADLVRYGYKDKQGNPYGIWKYYISSTKGYELYSEGYYTTIKLDQLVVDSDTEKRFLGSSGNELKADFITSLADPLIIHGRMAVL